MSIPSFSLEGQVAIITGSRRGIGKSIALIFAEVGADVIVCDTVVEGGELETVAENIKKLGRRSLAIQTDVTQKSDVDNLVQRVMDEFGAVDILVNNAGGGGGRRPSAATSTLPTFLELSEEDWDMVFDINFKGCLLCSQAASKGMIEQNKGSIINISSVGAERGPVNAYSIAKATVNRLTTGLALDLAKYNIRVNAIEPVWIRTEMTQRLWSNPETLRKYEALVPLGNRIGEVEDVSSLALFLASDASRFITGVIIPVDGGYLLPFIEHIDYIRR